MNRRSSKMGFVFIKRSAAGFSLVEIMVSLVISLFILGGAVTILMQNQQHYRYNDDFGRLQENARFALDLISSDLRMAGFWGCSINIRSQIPVATPGELLDTTFALDGFEQNTGRWAAQNNNEIIGSILAGTDGITIRKLRHSGTPVSTSLAANAPAITVRANASQLNQGDLAAIYNCTSTDIFLVTGVTPTTISRNAAIPFSIAYPQNASHVAAANVDVDGLLAQTFVAPFDAVRYFVSTADGPPTLWRQFHNGVAVTSQPIVEGIENMQILYGENTVPGGEPNIFRNANLVVDWNRVVAVKITLLVRTVEENPTQEIDPKTYDINGTLVTPGGRYSRRLVSATVLLRNLQTKIGT
jgi:type IV pilus assembly protein PilW